MATYLCLFLNQAINSVISNTQTRQAPIKRFSVIEFLINYHKYSFFLNSVDF